MSYLHYLCLFAYCGVQHILCCILCFVCLPLVSCVPNVASLSGLCILNCLFGFSNVYFISKMFEEKSIEYCTPCRTELSLKRDRKIALLLYTDKADENMF